MARLSELPEWERSHHLDKISALPDYGATPFALVPRAIGHALAERAGSTA